MIRIGLAIAALSLAIPAAAQGLLPGENAVEIDAIEGVVSGAAEWETAWSGPMTADGMTTAPDGRLLFAQEQSNAIWALWPDGPNGARAFVEVPYVLGAGAASYAPDGTLLAVERGCTDPGFEELECSQPSALVQLFPIRRVIADNIEGLTLGRLNDVHADGRGGAWVTQGALWHIDADGSVAMIYEPEMFTNGVVTSPENSRLYVTDLRTIQVFDLDSEGSASNPRVFATLDEDSEGFGGDGMTVDADGRLYVTGDAGVYVFAPDGEKLGVIPVPRRSITLAFAGSDRGTLYVGAMGAATPDGEAWETPHGERNVAMTIYKLDMLSSGN